MEKEAVTGHWAECCCTFSKAGKETQVLDLARLRPSLTRSKATAEKLWGVRPPGASMGANCDAAPWGPPRCPPPNAGRHWVATLAAPGI